MKSSKIVSFFLALFVMGITLSFAQDNEVYLTQSQKEELTKNVEEFAVVLGLSEEQKTEFEAITKKYAGKMIEVKNGGGSKFKKYKKVKAIRADKDAEMEQLLSEEQFVLYAEKQAEMQKKMKAKRDQI